MYPLKFFFLPSFQQNYIALFIFKKLYLGEIHIT